MYDCDNVLCDAHAPCEDSGFDNAALSECGCALRTTAYLPYNDPTCINVQCSTGVFSSNCDSLCVGNFVQDGCDGYDGNMCPSVPPYTNFYYDYPAPYLASWQTVPYNPDAGTSSTTALQCSATGRCGSTEPIPVFLPA
jgi:hypothetical protein